jgi:hypothetical protein
MSSAAALPVSAMYVHYAGRAAAINFVELRMEKRPPAKVL